MQTNNPFRHPFVNYEVVQRIKILTENLLLFAFAFLSHPEERMCESHAEE